MATGPRPVKDTRQQETETTKGPREFWTKLDLAETARVVYPLSEVTALLEQSPRKWLDDKPINEEDLLVLSLRQLLRNSPKLWEYSVRGVVVKCNETIASKVITGNKDYTEYTSMQYLMKQAPDIPAPRPHGLIAFDTMNAPH